MHNKWITSLVIVFACCAIAHGDIPSDRADVSTDTKVKADADIKVKAPVKNAGDTISPATVAKEGKADAKPKEETVRFQYYNVSYREVVQDFAQFVGKPLVGDLNIEGRLTFFDANPYTQVEAWDTINLLLSLKGYQLMYEGQHDRFLRLFKMEEVPAKARLVQDWLKAGKLRPGEIVTALLPLKYIDADSASAAVAKMVSSWGSITLLPQGKGIILTDSVGNIKRIREFIKLLDVSSAGKQQLKTFNLKHASASAVATIVKGIFASSAKKKVAFNARTNRYETITTSPAAVSVTADERTNSIILLGGGEKLAMIEAVISKLDERGGQQSGDMKIFILKNAKAADLAKTVQAAFSPASKKSSTTASSSRSYRDRYNRRQTVSAEVATSGSVRIIPDSVTNRLIVIASVDVMDSIAKMITDLDDATIRSGEVKIITLKVAIARELVGIITNAVSKRNSSGKVVSSLVVSADTRTNSLVLSGPMSEMTTAGDLISKLDQKSPDIAREIHVIHFKSGNVSQIAATLSRLFSKQTTSAPASRSSRWGIGSSPANSAAPKIEAEASTNTLIISATPANWPLLRKILDELKLDSIAAATTREIVLKKANCEEVAQALRKIYTKQAQEPQSSYSRQRTSRANLSTTGTGDTPIIIVAVKRSNSLLISAADDDHNAIAAVVEKLDVPESKSIDQIRMISLKAANCITLAEKLRAMIPTERGKIPDVFIDADSATNSLLIRAPESKRKMLEKIVAQLDKASLASARETRIIQLKHASASAVASVISVLVQTPSQSGIRSRNRAIAYPPATPSGGEDKVIVTAAPGDKAIILDGPRTKIEKIATLIKSLDSEVDSSNQQIRIYQLAHSNAAELAQKLARLFGKSASGNLDRGQVATSATGAISPRFEADTGTNQLLVSATMKQFEQIEKTIDKLTKTKLLISQTKTFMLKCAKASEIAPMLQSMLATSAPNPFSSRSSRPSKSLPATDVRVAIMAGANAIIVQGPPEKIAMAAELIKKFDDKNLTDKRTLKVVKLSNTDANSLAQTINQALGEKSTSRTPSAGREITVTAEINTNSLLIYAPSDEMTRVIKLVQKLDADAIPSQVAVKVIKLRNSDATELAQSFEKMFRDIIRQQPKTKTQSHATLAIVADARTNSLVVTTTPAYFALIEDMVSKLDNEEKPLTDVQIINLTHADSWDLSEQLSAIFASRRLEDRPTIEPGYIGNVITVIAKTADMKQIVKIINDQDTPDLSRHVQIVTLKSSAKARLVAQAIKRLYSASSSKTVIIKEVGPAPEPVNKTDFTPAKPPILRFEGYDDTTDDDQNQTQGMTIEVDEKTNALILSGTQKQLVEVQNLIDQLTASELAGEAIYRVYQITKADPVSVAATIEKLFNPPKSTQRISRQPTRTTNPNDRRQPRTPVASTSSSAPVIRAVADTRTKSIIVYAEAKIFELLDPIIEHLDHVPEIISEVKVFELENTSAADVARTLSELFRLASNTPTSRTTKGSKSPQQIRAKEISRQLIELKGKNGITRVDTATQVSITANTNANSIVAVAPAGAMELIDSLVQELDQSALRVRAVIRIYPIKHADVDSTITLLNAMFSSAGKSARARPSQAGASSGQVIITGNIASRQVIVSAPADKHELIKQALNQIDSASRGDKAEVKVYAIKYGDAASVASAIAASLGSSASAGGARGTRPATTPTSSALRVTYEYLSNTVVVRASQSEHVEVAILVERLDTKPACDTPRTITLINADASTLAATLTKLFAAASSNTSKTASSRGKVVIEANSLAAMLLVRADDDTFKKIKILASKLDLATPISNTTPTIIRLDNAQASSVANMISQAFTPQRGKVVTPDDLVIVLAEPTSNSLIVTASGKKLADVQALAKKLDTELASATRTEMIILKNTLASEVAAVLSQVATGVATSPRKGRSTIASTPAVLVTSSSASNALILAGPEKELDKLMKMAIALDKAGADVVPVVKLYTLVNTDPASMVMQIEKIFASPSQPKGKAVAAGKDAPVTVVADILGKRVIVSAPLQKHSLVAQVIKDIDDAHDIGKITVEVYKIENTDAKSMALGLSTAWARNAASSKVNPASDAVRITADRGSNSIIIRAPAGDHVTLGQLISQMDISPQDKYPIRHIPLNNADAANVAAVLSSVYSPSGSIRKNSGSKASPAGQAVVISSDADSRMLIVRAEAETFKEIRALAMLMDTAPASKITPTIISVPDGRAEVIATALSQAFAPRRGMATNPNDIVTIVPEAESDSLVVTANAENLSKINKLIDEFALRSSGGIETRFVLLKSAKAVDLEKVLTKIAEAKNPSHGKKSSARAAVTISADPTSNALLMSGLSDDLDELMKMAMQLDVAAVQTATGAYIIALDRGRAIDVAATVEKLYKSQATAALKEKRAIDPLAVSFDSRANAIILATTESMYAQVDKWVKELESLQPARGIMRILPLENADPVEVEKAIHQLFGESSSSSSSSSSSGNTRRSPANRNRNTTASATVSSGVKVETVVLQSQRAIMVTVSDEDFAAIQEMVAAMEKAAITAKQHVKIFTLKNATNVRVAAALSGIYSDRTDAKDRVRVTAIPQTTALLVSASKDMIDEVGHLIEQLDKKEVSPVVEFRIFPLENAKPTKILPMLSKMLSQMAKAIPGETVDVQADERTRSIIITAKSTLFEQVEQIIKLLDQAPAFASAEMIIIPLKKADATRLSSVLQEMLRPSEAKQTTDEALALQEQLRLIRLTGSIANRLPELDLTKPIKITSDPAQPKQQGSNSLILSSTSDNLKVLRALVERLDVAPIVEGVVIRIIHLKLADAKVLTEILREIFSQGTKLAGRAGSSVVNKGTPESVTGKALVHPLNISGDLRTNSIILSGIEESVALAEILVKDLDTLKGQMESQVKLFQLKNVDATKVLPLLQVAFETADTPNLDGARTFVSRLISVRDGKKPLITDIPKTRSAVALRAEETTNTIIVVARQDVMPLIADMIKSIDFAGAKMANDIQIFNLIHADSATISTTLTNMFDQRYSSAHTKKIQQSKPVIVVDTRTNSLLVSADTDDTAMIKTLLAKLDVELTNPAVGIVVIPLVHNDAAVIAPTLKDIFDARIKSMTPIGQKPQPSETLDVTSDALSNSLIISANKTNIILVRDLIKKIDTAPADRKGIVKLYLLKNANAESVAAMLKDLIKQGLYKPGAAQASKNPLIAAREKVAIAFDTRTNVLIISGSKENYSVIAEIIKKVDSGKNFSAKPKVFRLTFADATQTAKTILTLFKAKGGLSESLSISTDERGNSLIVFGGDGDIKYVADLIKQIDRKTTTQVMEIQFFPLKSADATEVASLLTDTLTNKPKSMIAGSQNRQSMLQFITETPQGKKLITSAMEQGVLITPDKRTNQIVVKARKEFMGLLAKLIEALDSTDPRIAEIKIISLENADATSMADVLTQMFQLTAKSQKDSQAVEYTLKSDGSKNPNRSATLGTAEQSTLTITVDVRTNSLLVGGTKQYVSLVSSVIKELDSSPAQERISQVYHLRNAKSEDIADALENFLTKERDRITKALGNDKLGAAMRLLEREVAVVAEPTSNRLLISASPRYFEKITSIIAELDQPPPQVLVQVLLAEVTLDDSYDLGADWAYQQVDGSRTTAANSTFGVEAGLAGFTGFNLSVTGGDLDFFFRALQTKGKLEVLSRPQILASDNQLASIEVGQDVPYITNSNISDSGRVNNTIDYRPVGILLSVTPRINDDGFVRMEISPEISSLADSSIQVSENVNAIIVNRRSAQTTVTVQDGHTIVIGGLITTTDQDRESKVPLLGDIPLIGELFKSTRKTRDRKELLIVLTPHILRTTKDADDITKPRLKRIEQMQKIESKDGSLRKLILESIKHDPELLKAITEEMERRKKKAPNDKKNKPAESDKSNKPSEPESKKKNLQDPIPLEDLEDVEEAR